MLDSAPTEVDIGGRLLGWQVKMVKVMSCTGNVLPVPALGRLLASGKGWDIEDYAIWRVRWDEVVGVVSDYKTTLSLAGLKRVHGFDRTASRTASVGRG